MFAVRKSCHANLFSYIKILILAVLSFRHFEAGDLVIALRFRADNNISPFSQFCSLFLAWDGINVTSSCLYYCKWCINISIIFCTYQRRQSRIYEERTLIPSLQNHFADIKIHYSDNTINAMIYGTYVIYLLI